jgi:predicted phage tail protein
MIHKLIAALLVVSSAFGASPKSKRKYTLSGNVSGAAATVTLSGATGRITTTDASGNYSFASLLAGNYAVTSSASGYSFSPAIIAVTISTANVSGANFVGTANQTPIPHSVQLNWDASTSPNVMGYNVYRAAIAGGLFVRLNSVPILGLAYTDSAVESGRTYYYTARAVDLNGESIDSNQAAVAVPFP